jgi:hypothetical protein
MLKKFLKLLAVLLVAIFVFGIYLYFTRNSGQPDGQPNRPFSFFPFGEPSEVNVPSVTPEPADPTDNQTETPTAVEPRIKQLSDKAVAGASIFTETFEIEQSGTSTEPETETVVFARFIQKEDGAIFDVNTQTSNTAQVSDTVIPRIYEAFFGGENLNSVILRYLKGDNETIETFGGEISQGKLSGGFFPQNISFLDISPDKNSVFYLTHQGEYTEGVTSDFENNNKKPIFDHPFSEWMPDWGNDSTITLTTLASSETEGFVYSLGASRGDFSKEFSGKDGLTTLTSPDGTKILYSEILNGALRLSVYDKQDRSHTNLGMQTLPEKCIWEDDSMRIWCGVPTQINTSNLPDMWYRGSTSFTDSVWLLDTESNAHQLISDPRGEANLYLDITKIDISPDESYMIFVDKKTDLLYGLSI